MSDFNPCNRITVGVGQSLVTIRPATSCRQSTSDIALIVYDNNAMIAAYSAHGIDASGIAFYLDGSVNSHPRSLRYEVSVLGAVEATGWLVVTAATTQYTQVQQPARGRCEV